MTYDFETTSDRSMTDSQKWQKYRGRDILPMWVADMDFRVAPEIVAAIHARADDGIFGYCRPVDSTVEAVLDYLRTRFNWEIQSDWIVWLPGLVPGINLAVRAVGDAGNSVLTLVPIYPPFLAAPKLAGRRCLQVALARAGERWEIDWEALEQAVSGDTRLFLLCHPHNPVGRVWRRQEIERIAGFCTRHDLVLCSDEIHCDLILDDLEHVPAATLGAEVAARTITLLAPSKTYNIAGLGCSYAVIPDPKIRAAFIQAGRGVLAEVNNFGYAACEAAYRHGEPWRQALLARLRANRDLLLDAVRNGRLPGVTATPIEATYLAWLGVESLGLDDPIGFFEEAGVGLSDGAFFGDRRYVRLNYGCPEATLREAIGRMSRALNNRTGAAQKG
jgi:cystathionine beta-lyase